MTKKKRIVNCRFCKEEMWFRNYRVHLTRAHPEANSSDLRAVNQQDIFSSFGKRKADASINQDDSQTKKARHASGDSGVCDGGEDSDLEEVDSENDNETETAETATETETVSQGLDTSPPPCSLILPEEVTPRNDNSGVEVKDIILVRIDKLEQTLLTKMESLTLNSNEKNSESTNSTPPPISIEENEQITKLQLAKEVKDLDACGFVLNEEVQSVVCNLCSIEFKCETQFFNLKKNLKRHLGTNSHLSKVKEMKEKAEEEKRVLSLNTRVGLNLARACYKILKKGRPYSDYEDEVYLLKIAGALVGNKDHSRKFVPGLAGHISKVITSDLRKYLSTPLQQTGKNWTGIQSKFQF